jgi:hypothetical protein
LKDEVLDVLEAFEEDIAEGNKLLRFKVHSKIWDLVGVCN